MRKRYLLKIKQLCFFIGLFATHLVYASNLGIGEVANNIMDPVTVFSDFIYSGCLIVGGSFLFASIIKYIDHRRSPLMVPISTPIFLLIAGIVLILLPFLPYLTDSGVPYSFLN